MKINDLERYPVIGNAFFHSVQLDLPFDTSDGGEYQHRDLHSVQWRSPHDVLSDYLAAVAVENPDDVARALLDEFDSLSDLLAGSWWRLKRAVGGRLTAVIRSSRDLMQTALSEPLAERPIVPASKHLLQFLRFHLGFLPHERLMAIYVDARARLLRIQEIADGSVSSADANVSRILRCGLSVGASGILLVHNHPSGVPRPSDADVQFTDRLRSAAKLLDMYLLDHLIIARDQVGSIYDFWNEARWNVEPS